jgi:hypothetical protein
MLCAYAVWESSIHAAAPAVESWRGDPVDDEQTFLVEAQRVRDQQVAETGGEYQPDPAIQDAIDAAEASGTEPGSGEPGFLGLGGLSNSEIEAQKQDIAQRGSSVDAPVDTP